MKESHRKNDVCPVQNRSNVVPFQRDAGFYLKKGMFHYRRNRLEKALFYFQKAVSADPQDAANHYNLACMLSKIGRLHEANRIFLYILRELDPKMTDCYFLLAINYGLLEEMDKSQYFLERYLQLDPEGDMAYEASELLSALDENYDAEPFSAQEYNLYLEKILAKTGVEEVRDYYRQNPGFRRKLRNWLYAGPDEFKEDIISFYTQLGGKKAKAVLLDYVRNPWVKERFRQLALLALKDMGHDQAVRVFMNGQMCQVDLNQYPFAGPQWRQEWQQVVDCTIQNMKKSNCYDDGFFEDVQAIWQDFINTVYPDTPRITKVQTWAAALEYSLARFHYLDLTQKELAAEYGVSCASISGKYQEINRALRLEEKAYRNMLSYLKGEHD
ncbi:MAG: hypothetical protein GX200_02700 [Firmicutes bacterium]|nr:hypothetical protein [Bacillota bacterium]